MVTRQRRGDARADRILAVIPREARTPGKPGQSRLGLTEDHAPPLL
jgi:hypothetical protein